MLKNCHLMGQHNKKSWLAFWDNNNTNNIMM